MTQQEIDELVDSLQVGADPEVFLFKDDAPISAVGIVPGTKANPFKVDKGAVQLDGMAAEFNIDPARSPKEFNENIQAVLTTLKEMVGEHNLSAVPVAHFGHELIAAQPDSARELGCEPDYNAYTGKENPRPDVNTPFRTGAGHVHIGWTTDADPFSEAHFNDCRVLAKQLDAFLGIPSLGFDTDDTRRELYGDWGAFRPKPYGMEYRVLSNAWLKHPELIEWVFSNTKLAFRKLLEDRELEVCHPPEYCGDITSGYSNVYEVCVNYFDIPMAPDVNGEKYVR
tara:strand:- start:8148 stop:8996 length:849 start_codon:yes stop_codon:yes gene_type:complete